MPVAMPLHASTSLSAVPQRQSGHHNLNKDSSVAAMVLAETTILLYLPCAEVCTPMVCSLERHKLAQLLVGRDESRHEKKVSIHRNK